MATACTCTKQHETYAFAVAGRVPPRQAEDVPARQLARVPDQEHHQASCLIGAEAQTPAVQCGRNAHGDGLLQQRSASMSYLVPCDGHGCSIHRHHDQPQMY